VDPACASDGRGHGGTITTGSTNVLIEGRPAARVGDLVQCPAFTGLIPHVGGPIATGSLSVRINDRPAARSGDRHTETGPGGVLVGRAGTVLIGD